MWSVGSRRHIVVGLATLVVAAGCHCADETLRGRGAAGLRVSAVSGPTCDEGRAQLQALVSGGFGPYRYRWVPAEGLDDPTSAAPVAEPGFAATYTVFVTDAESFEASSTVSPIRSPAPAPAIGFLRGGETSCDG